ncbi:hypothetical protein SYJ56_22170 [Algoriphagus sp. D3-2-R+10]|uniref:hypothetical protein n=1 Tax=Algoriphagus aurantiacus TaxID=3103948 RepID=UPI002B397A62|nr:hypothetical protein [Algoriphagus sp. D3-2-R+10]MEB2778036.1 hypothetical protein [Algoriphagus sp. D3-2-R+10]
MKIQTSAANFLIEKCYANNGCVIIRSNSQEELFRFFGSLEISVTNDLYYAYEVQACKQEFANAMIIMVKEIDYSEFSEFSLQMA